MKNRFAAPRTLGIICLAAVVLICSCMYAEADDMYTWTDSNGTVHVSQTPCKGARKLKGREEAPSEQESAQNNNKASLFLGAINDTNYFLDRESVQTFANDRNKYRFNLYVNDNMYTCTAWAYASAIVNLSPVRYGLLPSWRSKMSNRFDKFSTAISRPAALVRASQSGAKPLCSSVAMKFTSSKKCHRLMPLEGISCDCGAFSVRYCRITAFSVSTSPPSISSAGTAPLGLMLR